MPLSLKIFSRAADRKKLAGERVLAAHQEKLETETK